MGCKNPYCLSDREDGPCPACGKGPFDPWDGPEDAFPWDVNMKKEEKEEGEGA